MNEASSCIQAQISVCRFGHQRRDNRFSSLMQQLLKNDISQSFPSLFGCQYELKNFYRFVNNASVTHQKIIEGYQQGLINYSLREQASGDQQTWYMIHDSSLASYNGRNKLDLGYLEQVESNGFVMHNGLLLNNCHEPLGLLHQQIIVRDRQDYGKRHRLKERAFEERESYKWIASLQSGQRFEQAGQRKLIHIMDREADVGALFNAAVSAKQNIVVRARHNRSFLTEQERHLKSNKGKALTRLWDYLRAVSPSAIIQRQLRDDKGNGYQAPCHLSYHPVKLRDIKQPLYAVYLKEIIAPGSNQEAIEWLLLTNLEVEEQQQALHVMDIYMLRWTIEDFHKCLKSGCKLEQRQFDSLTALTNVLALLNLTAVRLLRMRYLAQHKPTHAAEEVFSQDELKLARHLAPQYLKPVDLKHAQPTSILWLVLLLARMGGHQGIRQKGLPGWQTLWKGYQLFEKIYTGFKINLAPG